MNPDQATTRPQGLPGFSRAARLLSRLYGQAGAVARTEMLSCLLQPLGLLGMAGAAAGCFSPLITHDQAAGRRLSVEQVARYSPVQVLELAQFVEDVDRQALRRAADVITRHGLGPDRPIGVTLPLLYRAIDASVAAPLDAI